MYVAARLVEVADPGTGGVRDRGRLRHTHPKHPAGGAGGTGTHPHQYPDRPGAHQVERGGERGASPKDHREVESRHEALQVERLGAGGDVFGRDHRPLDHQNVQTRLHGCRGVFGNPLWGETGRGGDPRRLHLLDPLAHQVGLDRLQVDLLHPPGRLLIGKVGDLLKGGIGILVPGPQALEVEHPEATKAADGDGRRRTHRRIHRRSHQGKREPIGIDLPGDVDIVGVAGAPAGHDGDVVQAICPAGELALADLDFHSGALSRSVGGG